jgi:hypothetical protein
LKDICLIITKLREEIEAVFLQLDLFLNEPEPIKSYKTKEEGWTINQILEHISLTDHYLLKLILKGSKKAIRKCDQVDIEKELIHYDFNDPDLEFIGHSDSFPWKSPEHMMPEGRSTDEISARFRIQKEQLMNVLDALKNGEGILHKTTMRVYQLGKLDVYQYIHFLLLHARRHIEQMEELKNSYNSHK